MLIYSEIADVGAAVAELTAEQFLEQDGPWELSEELFLLKMAELPPSRERQARILERRGHLQESLELCREIVSDPSTGIHGLLRRKCTLDRPFRPGLLGHRIPFSTRHLLQPLPAGSEGFVPAGVPAPPGPADRGAFAPYPEHPILAGGNAPALRPQGGDRQRSGALEIPAPGAGRAKRPHDPPGASGRDLR